MLIRRVASRQVLGEAVRWQSTAATQRPKAFVSSSNHPHFNLSLEHLLLRSQKDVVPIGLLYRNGPCIVVGRNQNPWRELDVSRMRKLGIRLVRRRSGGGAVYHDLGNTNYSFHVGREHFTRRANAELVARALNRPPVQLTHGTASDPGDTQTGAYVNDRNDICVRLAADGAERKVSGSAYKITSSRAYHHGTMLLSSNLADLGGALRPCRAAMDSKGVVSVPSPVVNLSDAFPSRRQHLHHDGFCRAVLAEFERTYGAADVHDGIAEDNLDALADAGKQQDLLSGWREMDSWDWMWGQTPEFTHRVQSQKERALHVADFSKLQPFEIHLHVKHGLVQEATVQTDDDDLARFVARLPSRRYDILADAPDTFSSEAELTPGDSLETVLQHVGVDAMDHGREAAIARLLLPWLKTVL